MTSPDEIKAGKYELLALRWDETTSKPGEAFEFVRHHRGDIVTLSAEEARRLVLSGAAGKPGELQRIQLAQAQAQLAAAQAAYDAVHAALSDDLGPVADQLVAPSAEAKDESTTSGSSRRRSRTDES